MVNTGSRPPVLAEAFTAGITRHFDSLQDMNCKVPVFGPEEEVLQLYASTPFDRYPDLHDVMVTRPGAGNRSPEQTDNPATQQQLEIPTRNYRLCYYVLGNQIHKVMKPPGKLWQVSRLLRDRHWKFADHHAGIPISEDESRAVVTFIEGLREQPAELYLPQSAYDGGWSWSAHYKLPVPLPRKTVLDMIHGDVQVQKDQPEKGLSGVLIGPDDNAETVTEVIFARDPSRAFGLREDCESDMQVARLAMRNQWQESDQSEDILEGVMRTIMGRNKDLYGGEAAFTLEEARNFLPSDTLLRLGGGYLFSSRPGWKAPYGEPAVITEAPDSPNMLKLRAQGIKEMGHLAWQLSRQDRWVLEKIDGTIVFKSNVERLGPLPKPTLTAAQRQRVLAWSLAA